MAHAARCLATSRTSSRAVAKTSPRCGGTRAPSTRTSSHLQEVDGAEAARLVFPDYQFCFSGRVAVQNNGFAIRRGLPFSCGPDLADLSMNDDVRRGVELRVFPGTPQELRLLSVHLKSGCSRDPLDSTRAGCAVLARQVPVLERWIDAQANEQQALRRARGFQPRPAARARGGLRSGPDIDDADPPAADLVNTAEGQAFQNCMPSQTFSGYIDYIILGRQMAQGLVQGFVRTCAFPAERRAAPQAVRSLPGIYPTSGGRRRPRHAVNQKNVKISLKPIKFSSVQTAVSQGNNP